MAATRKLPDIIATMALTKPATLQLEAGVQFKFKESRIASVSSGQVGGEGLLALPAMVNAHDHGFGMRPLGFGGGDDCLECWIPGLMARPATDPRLEAEVAFGRMALAGIGSTIHCHNSLRSHCLEQEAADVCAAAATVGLRVGFSCPIVDDNAWVYGGPAKLRPLLPADIYQQLTAMNPPKVPGREQIARVATIANELESENFVVQYGPIGPQWCTVATLEQIAEASANEDRRVHMHLLESKRQRVWLDQVYPGGVVQFLDKIGLLSPRLTVAHGVWLDDADCELLAERGVTVVTNAACNLRLRSGIAPLARFAKYGVAVAVGLDGLALNDNQDYLTDLRLVSLLHNGTGLEEDLPRGPFLHQVLANGFHTVCNESGYGQLTKGAHADLLLLDYATMANDLLVDDMTAATELIFGRMSATHVRHLYVGGTQIVEDGKLCNFDFAAAQAELIAQAQTTGQELRTKLELIDKQKNAIRQYYGQIMGTHITNDNESEL